MADFILVPPPAASTITAEGRDALTRLDSLMSLTLTERAETYPPDSCRIPFTGPGAVRHQSFWPVPDKPRRPTQICRRTGADPPAKGPFCNTGSVAQWVLHVDLDQFIAAVEVLRRPELRGLPIVVGGDGDPTKRGVVATASYEARVLGVHSGLPMRTAARRCPDCVFLPSDREAYEAASDRVMTALRSLGAVTEVMGWDEAFLAVDTDDPEDFARNVQHTITSATLLECTVGIGENKLQAKLATNFGKPAGVFRLTHATWFELLGAEPVSVLWGVGAKTAAKLAALGIVT